MARKVSTPAVSSATNTAPAFIAPAMNKATFDSLCTLLERNTTDQVTLLSIKSIQRTTRPIPGVPGMFPDVPADYAVGITKIASLAKVAGEAGVLTHDIVCEQIAYFHAKAEGVTAKSSASETAIAMREAKARARREMRAK